MSRSVIGNYFFRWSLQRLYNYFCIVALMWLGVASTAQAAYGPEPRLQSLDIPEVVWESAHILQAVTQPLHMRPFSSSQPAVELAKTLSGYSNIFQRVLVSKDKIVLSGLQPGWHWLAEITAIPGGAEGYISALYVDGARLQTSGNNRIEGDQIAVLPSLSFPRK